MSIGNISGGGGATGLPAGATIPPQEGFALGARFYINPTAAPIDLPDPLTVADALAAGFTLQGAVAYNQDGERVGTTVRLIDPDGTDNGIWTVFDDAALNTESKLLSDGTTFIGVQS